MDLTDELKITLKRIEGAVHVRAALIEGKIAAHKFYLIACALCVVLGAALDHWSR